MGGRLFIFVIKIVHFIKIGGIISFLKVMPFFRLFFENGH